MRLLPALTCAMVLVDTVFYAALVPHFAEEFGLSKSSAGILIGAFGVGMLLRSAPSGYLMARGEANGACGTRFGVWRELALRVRGRDVGALRAPARSEVREHTFLGFGVHVARDASPEERRRPMTGTLLSTAPMVGVSPVFASTMGLVVAGWGAF